MPPAHAICSPTSARWRRAVPATCRHGRPPNVPASAPATAAQPPVVVDIETGARVGSLTPQQAQFLIDALEESSTDEPRYYIDAATIEMLEGSGADADLVALLRQALAGRDGMEIRF